MTFNPYYAPVVVCSILHFQLFVIAYALTVHMYLCA